MILYNLIKIFNDQPKGRKVISGAPHRVMSPPGGGAPITLPELLHVSHTPGKNPLLPTKLPDLQLEDPQVLHPLVVLALAFIQHGLLDLDLLIEQGQLVVAPNKLRPEDISLTDHLDREERPWPPGD